jgi:hypothetical protein
MKRNKARISKYKNKQKKGGESTPPPPDSDSDSTSSSSSNTPKKSTTDHIKDFFSNFKNKTMKWFSPKPKEEESKTGGKLRNKSGGKTRRIRN